MSKIRFLINPMGSHGDVDPLLAIGRELLGRGHEVIVLTNETYGELVESLGMQFVQVGSIQDMQDVGNDPRIRKQGQAWKVALQWTATGTMRETYRQIERLYINGRTVVASAITSFGARLANERLGVPLATILVDPDKLRGTEHSPVMAPLWLSDSVPRPIKKLQFLAADRFVIDPIVAPLTNEFRKELGLRPVRRLLNRWWFSPDLVIGLFHDWFAPRSSDWPANVRLVGPILWNPASEAKKSNEVLKFVRSGRPPVAFIAGSAGPTDKHFFRVAAEIAIELGLRAIFLHNNPNIIPKNLPETVRYFDYYSPLYALLRECRALVHHAGTGTAFHAMAAAIPHLVSPQAFDQPDIAMRLRRLGVAQIVDKKDFTSKVVVSNLRSLLSDEALKSRCEEIALRLNEHQSACLASDLLEKLVVPAN